MSAASATNAIIGTEVLSLIIYLVLLMGSLAEGGERSKRTNYFIVLVVSAMVGCFCDLLSWLLDGHSELTLVLHFTTLCSMVMTMVMAGVYISYLSAYVSEKKVISKTPAIVAWATIAVGLLFTFVAGITGNLFAFQDGYFLTKPLYSVYVIVNTAYLIIGIIILAIYRKVLDWHDKVAGYAYILIPVISAAIGLCVENWDFSYPAITVSLLILYIVIQSDRTKKLEKEGIIANYQATHDALTGLYNRKVYQDRIQLMQSSNEESGVIFGDLNGLKYVNDTFGHEEGDRMLIRFADLLKERLRMYDIYRISGDEFICVMENCPQETFRKRVSELESALNRENPPMACVGAVYGSSRDIEALIKDAEKIMYEKKKVIHENFTQTKR